MEWIVVAILLVVVVVFAAVARGRRPTSQARPRGKSPVKRINLGESYLRPYSQVTRQRHYQGGNDSVPHVYRPTPSSQERIRRATRGYVKEETHHQVGQHASWNVNEKKRR